MSASSIEAKSGEAQEIVRQLTPVYPTSPRYVRGLSFDLADEPNAVTARVDALQEVVLSSPKPPEFLRPPSILKTKPEVKQKGYWENGIVSGVYYLFIYHFFLDQEKKALMNTIYEAVALAVEEKRCVNVKVLAKRLLDQDEVNRAVLLEQVTYYLPMIQHALGVDMGAEKLLLELYQQDFSGLLNQNEVFLHHLILHMVGEDLLEQATEALLPDEMCCLPKSDYSMWEWLDRLVETGRAHPFYRTLKAAFYEERDADKEIMKHVINEIKTRQKKEVDTSVKPKFFSLKLGAELESRLLQKSHMRLDQHFELFCYGNRTGSAILRDYLTEFSELTSTNFRQVLDFVKTHEEVLTRIINRKEEDLKKIVGSRAFEKIAALVKLRSTHNVQAVLERILHFFFALEVPCDDAKDDAKIVSFFDLFENEIKEPQWKIPRDSAPFRVIGKAIEEGHKVLHAYLANLLGKELYTKLLHECVYQVARANKPIMQVTWQEDDGSYQAGILEGCFDSETIYEALCGVRKKAFGKMWGEENRQFLEDYFYAFISGPGIMYDIELGEALRP